MRSGRPVIHADNRGFRYGEGVFETIRIKEGRIILAKYHFERLFSGIELLQFEQPPSFTEDILSRQVEELCKKNNHQLSARVRLMVFRSDGSLRGAQHNYPNYIVQSRPLLPGNPEMNENGLLIDVYPDGRKAMDTFSNLKSNNYLLYIMAAKYAKNHLCDDCLVLNSSERICEGTVANIFCVKNERIYTPPLSEGCVAGVTRRFLLEKMKDGRYPIDERKMDIEFVKNSDEIFLTNAIYGFRWVGRLGDRQFGNTATRHLYQSFMSNIF